MKTHFTYVAAVFISMLALFSCSHDNEFVISGTVKNPGQVKAVYLFQADSTTISMVDSHTLSEDGTFKFKHNGAYPNLYKIRLGGAVYDLIAQNGDDITFGTDMNDNMHNYHITGSQESQKIQEYNKLSNGFVEKTNQLETEFQTRLQSM